MFCDEVRIFIVMIKKTTQQFIKDAIKIHKMKFDYSLSDYKGVKTPITIKCDKGHIFQQKPNDHLNGFGCKICKGWGETKLNFVKKANEIHNNLYDYSKSIYIDHDSPLIIICKIHGEFKQSPKGHLIMKNKCPKCSGIEIGNKNRDTKENFIEKANKIHNEYYNYSLVNYKGANQKIKIICHKHGIFKQHPKDHINQKHGCPKCKNSKGEIRVEQYLRKNNINYISQQRFEECKNKRSLPFDFYLPDHKICIEYDGEQHFRPSKRFGGKKNFSDILRNDNIKNEYCLKNKIKLIRIKYTQKENIEQILKENKIIN